MLRPAAWLRPSLSSHRRQPQRAVLASSIKEGGTFCCFECGLTFKDRPALMGHAARVHGYRHPARKLVLASHCTICLKHFWSPERVFHHYLRSGCGPKAEQLVVPLQDEQTEELFAAARTEARSNVRQGQSHRKALRAAVQLEGPKVEGA